MDETNRPASYTNSAISASENKLIGLIKLFISTDLEWVGRILLKLLLFKWRRRSIQTENNLNQGASLPVGPFVNTRKKQAGDLLLWVPRSIESYLIDELTGGYGYSHTSIDTGEIDIPTQRPVMAEITIGQTVTRKFQDEYGPRAFVRLPLSNTGVDIEQFVECVKSKMGEQYDAWDAITLGEIVEPAKEVCSGLAADCLPEKERQQIAQAARLGLLHKASVSVHSKASSLKTKEFISPNGFAEYYGAPKGRKIDGPNTVVEPQPVEISVLNITTRMGRHYGWKILAEIFAIVLLVFMLKPIAQRSK
jgi:hypothetical protein